MRYLMIFLGCIGLVGVAWWCTGGGADARLDSVGGGPQRQDSGAGGQVAGELNSGRHPGPIGTEGSGERQVAPDPADSGFEGEAGGELELDPSKGLRVHVVDEEGRSVGGVVVELELAVFGMGQESVREVVSRDSDGVAVFEIESLNELRAQMESLGARARLWVRADVPSPSPVRHRLDAWPSPGDRVELTVPATGSVLVRVFLPDGEPAPEGMSVGWRWLPADVAREQPDEGYERPAKEFIEGEGGVVRIDGVGLDLALSLSAWMPGRQSASAKGVQGPTRPGEVVEVEMTLGVRHGEVVFRVLDPAGVPLAKAKLRGRQFEDVDRVLPPNARPPRATGHTLWTDEEGFLHYAMVAGSVEGARRLDLVRGRPGGREEEIRNWSSGSVLLPRSVASGERIELGDLWLRPARILLDGYVVDGQGIAIEGASLDFDWRIGTSPEHVWHRGFQYRIETDSRGYFQLLDIREPADLRFQVRAEGYSRQSVEGFEVGTRNLVVELDPAEPESEPERGSLRVRVEMDPDVSFMRCKLRVRSRVGGGRSPDWFPGAPLEIGSLDPGTYDVWIETRDGDFELARVEGIEVLRGEVTEDPRLLPFDATGTARTIVFRLERPDGSPWRRQNVHVRVPGRGSPFSDETDDEGLLRCILPSDVNDLDVGIDADRIHRVEVHASEDPVVVVFED